MPSTDYEPNGPSFWATPLSWAPRRRSRETASPRRGELRALGREADRAVAGPAARTTGPPRQAERAPGARSPGGGGGAEARRHGGQLSGRACVGRFRPWPRISADFHRPVEESIASRLTGLPYWPFAKDRYRAQARSRPATCARETPKTQARHPQNGVGRFRFAGRTLRHVMRGSPRRPGQREADTKADSRMTIEVLPAAAGRRGDA